MRREQESCQDCGLTEHLHLGFIPESVLAGTRTDIWINAAMCTECGSLTPLKPDIEQIERSEERYINLLVEESIISPEEAENVLG